jgi:hypothetical protein
MKKFEIKEKQSRLAEWRGVKEILIKIGISREWEKGLD